MIIGQLINKKYDISCNSDKNSTTAEATAYLPFNNVWKLYSLLLSPTLDGGNIFIFRVWKNLFKILGIKLNLLTAFFPDTEKQCKIANQEMK